MQTVYIEWVLIENGLIDGGLLTLSLFLTRQPRKGKNIFAASILGGAFALLFPLLPLTRGLQVGMSFLFATVLVFCAMDHPRKKEFFFTLGCFYLLSFSLAGGILSVPWKGGVSPTATLYLGFFFFLFCVWLSREFYRRGKIAKNLYRCKSNGVTFIGFWDSGNLAKAHGVPVIFVSPKLFYALLNVERGAEEMTIQTMSGERKIKIFPCDVIEIYLAHEIHKIERVYISPSKALPRAGYEAILQSEMLGEGG